MATRLSVNINDETAKALRELSLAEGTTVTEIVRRMTGLYKFVKDETKDGSTIQLVSRDGREHTKLAML